MITNNIVNRNTNRKSDSSIDRFAINLFGIQFGSLCLENLMTEFTKIQNLGTRYTLSDEPFKSKVHNFGRFLIFGANVTERKQKSNGR